MIETFARGEAYKRYKFYQKQQEIKTMPASNSCYMPQGFGLQLLNFDIFLLIPPSTSCHYEESLK